MNCDFLQPDVCSCDLIGCVHHLHHTTDTTIIHQQLESSEIEILSLQWNEDEYDRSYRRVNWNTIVSILLQNVWTSVNAWFYCVNMKIKAETRAYSIYHFKWHKLSLVFFFQQYFKSEHAFLTSLFCVLNFWLILFSLCRVPPTEPVLFLFFFYLLFHSHGRLLDKHMDRVKMVWPFSIIEKQ
jgi:hypothetical protein